MEMQQDVTDEELMRRLQQGQMDAFEEIFSRYQARVLGLVRAVTGGRHDVEALGQEAFLRLLKRADSYQYPKSFRTWFFTVVRHLCIDACRKKRPEDRAPAPEPVDHNDALSQIIRSEQTAQLLDALGALPESHREVVVLRAFQGCSYRAISEIVGAGEATVRSRMRYALNRLREQLIARG